MVTTQVAISTTFFNSFAKLQKSTQRKIIDFVDKFRNNPYATGINYEKIFNAKDDNIYSVRIDNTYRGIVSKEDNTGTHVLLWVDHHDDAYNWASRHKCKINSKTGSLQLYSVNENIIEKQTTINKEYLFKNLSDEQLLNLAVPQDLIQRIRLIISQDEFKELKFEIPVDAYENLEWIVNDFSYEEVIASIEQQKAKDMKEALQNEQSKRSFVVLDDDIDLMKIMSEPLEKWRVFLHPVQRQIVNKIFSGPARILGSAGTGKTVVAMHRANVLAEKCKNNEKILFTTFTSNLAKDIEDNLRKICNSSAQKRIEVINIDAWISQFLKSQDINYEIKYDDELSDIWNKSISNAGEELNQLAKFYIDEWNSIICANEAFDVSKYCRTPRIGRGIRLDRKARYQVWKIFEEYMSIMKEKNYRDINWAAYDCKNLIVNNRSNIKNYSSIIVDEGQDLSMSVYRLLRTIAGEEHQNDIFIVGDSHQRIYKNKAILSKAGLNIRGRSSKLKINYRTTEEIRKYATSILKDIDFDDMDDSIDILDDCQSLTHGDFPSCNSFKNLNQELEYLLKKIKELQNNGVQLKNICITARTNALLDDYKVFLQKNNLPIFEIKRNKIDNRDFDGIRIATMHRIKGLEFRYVFIVSINKGVLPLSFTYHELEDNISKAEYIKSEKCLFYVALTRAQKEVFISSYGTKSDFLN